MRWTKSRVRSHCSLEALLRLWRVLQHILPQNPELSAPWRDALGPDWQHVQEEWLHRLGNLTLTGLFGVLGFFLLFQAQRVRFVFTDEDLQVLIGDELEKSGENAFVGGENKWKYDTFVNWEFWWPGFPCLVYFKETQTKPEGQIHFFPIIMDGQQLYDVMVERCGNSQNSLPDN